MLRHAHTWSVLLCALLLCTGCGNKVPVSGTITLDGVPVSEAGVVFVPDETGPTASGSTDAQGRYELKTGKELGVKPGKYKVAISKEKYSGGKANAEGLELEDAGGGFKVQWLIPKRYSETNTSGLSAEVTSDGSNKYDFQLKK